MEMEAVLPTANCASVTVTLVVTGALRTGVMLPPAAMMRAEPETKVAPCTIDTGATTEMAPATVMLAVAERSNGPTTVSEPLTISVPLTEAALTVASPATNTVELATTGVETRVGLVAGVVGGTVVGGLEHAAPGDLR